MTEIWFLLIEAIFGVPTAFLLGILFIRLGYMVPPAFKVRRAKTILALFLVFICSIGVLSYAVVFILELYELFNCEGASCAQGSLGTFVFTPVAWLSWLLAWSAARVTFNSRFFPQLPGLTLRSSGTAHLRHPAT